MAVEIFFNFDNEREGRRLWKGPLATNASSWSTWVAFMVYVERKYLPSLPEPYPLNDATPSYHSRMFQAAMSTDAHGDSPMQEIYDLLLSPEMSDYEKLTMLTMLDNASFKVEDSEAIYYAWRKVGQQLGKKNAIAFSLLINKCEEIIKRNDNVGAIAINWNSDNNFPVVFGHTDDRFFDVMSNYETLKMATKDD